MEINKLKFKMWYYTVSHGQLLLRSNGSTNIDIYFGDVIYIEIPTSMSDLTVRETTKEDDEYIRKKIGKVNNTQKITVLLCENRKYYIVSSVMMIMENSLSAFELPFDIPNDMGNIYTTVHI